MTKLTRLFDYVKNRAAIIHPYNGTYRVLDGENIESFYYDYNKALLALLADGYKLTFIDNNAETWEQPQRRNNA